MAFLGHIEASAAVRDQEVVGSNPTAPTKKGDFRSFWSRSVKFLSGFLTSWFLLLSVLRTLLLLLSSSAHPTSCGTWPWVPDTKLVGTCSFRFLLQTSSDAALIGSATTPQPREIFPAHHGVQFLSELPRFARYLFEVLRQSL
jgi:hypothetical protein